MLQLPQLIKNVEDLGNDNQVYRAASIRNYLNSFHVSVNIYTFRILFTKLFVKTKSYREIRRRRAIFEIIKRNGKC